MASDDADVRLMTQIVYKFHNINNSNFGLRETWTMPYAVLVLLFLALWFILRGNLF